MSHSYLSLSIQFLPQLVKIWFSPKLRLPSCQKIILTMQKWPGAPGWVSIMGRIKHYSFSSCIKITSYIFTHLLSPYLSFLISINYHMNALESIHHTFIRFDTKCPIPFLAYQIKSLFDIFISSFSPYIRSSVSPLPLLLLPHTLSCVLWRSTCVVDRTPLLFRTSDDFQNMWRLP